MEKCLHFHNSEIEKKIGEHDVKKRASQKQGIMNLSPVFLRHIAR